MAMQARPVIFAVISSLLVIAIYSSSYMFQVFVEGVIDGDISCSPQGNGKTYCCASTVDWDEKEGFVYQTYCTTCDDTNPPSNCTEREKPLVVVNPGKMLSNVLEGGVLEEPTTQPKLGEDVLPKGGGVLEQPENNMTFSRSNVTFPLANDSDDNTNNTFALLQSDIQNDMMEDKTTAEDAGEEQDESDTIEEDDN